MADAGREATVAAEKETAALKKLQAAAGFSTGHVERLDWMYEQSVTAKPDDDKLMNMAVAGQSDKDLEDMKKLQESTAGSLFLKSATKTTEDMLRKLREDPLFQIKRQEQAARENMMANPLVVAKLQRKQAKASKKEEKKAKKAAKKEKKAMKKAAKKDKKARKKAGEKVSSSSSSSSSSSEGAKPGSAQMAATLSAMTQGRARGGGGGGGVASSSAKRPRSRSASPFGRGEGLGPSSSVVDKRAEHARLIAERRDAALASRGATKRLGEDERQRKLEQMRSDAQTHERTKDHRIARAEQRDREEMEKEEEMRKTSDQRYFREMREQAYMGDTNATMADRLKNQRHRRQKNLNDPLERDG